MLNEPNMTRKTDREKRLAEALRQNLARRKAQQRARTAGQSLETADAPNSAPSTVSPSDISQNPNKSEN